MPTVKGMYMSPGTRGGNPVVADKPHEPRRTDGLFSTWEVVEAAGLSYRIVDYWARCEPATLGPSVVAEGSGSRRAWSPAEFERVVKGAAMWRACSVFGGSTRPNQRGTQGPSVDAIARFVREATRNSVGDWVWECADFTLIVAGQPDYPNLPD